MSKVYFVKTSEIAGKLNSFFETERNKLSGFFPDADIQHIGGTSVPNSISKGDLDINIRVNKSRFNKTIEKLKNIYDINQPENWTDNFASLKDDSRDLGVQVTVIDSPEDQFVAQRDFLITHPERLEELNKLKQNFEGKDMDEYRKAKSEFFEKLRINYN